VYYFYITDPQVNIEQQYQGKNALYEACEKISENQTIIIKLLLEYISPATVMPKVLFKAISTLNVELVNIIMQDCRTRISESQLELLIKTAKISKHFKNVTRTLSNKNKSKKRKEIVMLFLKYGPFVARTGKLPCSTRSVRILE
jgi:hypothetical protein